jgi:sterol desaturase/sphingolipid hydroxylase (fatty acid hydroxylase superfamily)
MLLWKLRGTVVYETRDAAASLIAGLGNVIIGALTGGLVYALYGWVYRFRVFDPGATWWTVAIALVAKDFVFYWGHRWSHEVRFIWANHVTHHSSQHYNLSTALRQPWVASASMLFLLGLPVIWLGIPPAIYGFAAGVNLVYQFFLHTEAVGRLGPLEWVLNTPSHHRVHHGTNPRYLDANYGGMLIIWDRLFGTFTPEEDSDPVRYGLVKNLRTFNPAWIAFHEYVGMARDVARARSLAEVWGYVFGRPGWSPDGSRKTAAMIQAEWRRRSGQVEDAGDARHAEPAPVGVPVHAASQAGQLGHLG